MTRKKLALLNREQREQQYLAYRVKMLPDQLERARRRVIHLEREAARLGLHDLLEGKADRT